MSFPPKDGEITAAALLLAVLGRHRAISEAELLKLARQRGLRGGALPLKAGLDLIRQSNLSIGEDSLMLTDAGRVCLDLLHGSEEPTPGFRDTLVALTLTTPQARILLANIQVDELGHVSDPRGIADPLLEYLARFGDLRQIPNGGWQLGASGDALAVGGPIVGGQETSDPQVSAEVGARGEELSIRYEELRTGVKPVQVSRISSYFGFDLRSVQSEKSRREIAVEVKATVGERLVVNWSANEARTALLLGRAYWIHIWGEVDTTTSPHEEYERLRSRGYPVVIAAPAHIAGEVVRHSAAWASLENSRLRTDNFLWEFFRQ